MRYSLVLLASAVSATILPRGFGKAPVAPKGSYPTFQTLTLDEAIQGLDRELMGLPGGAANISTHRGHKKHPARAIERDGDQMHTVMTRDAASVSHPNRCNIYLSYLASWFLGVGQIVA